MLRRSTPSPAQDLYQSDWFIKARSYVESQGHDWHILSAKYGLLDRDAITEPYEQTLNDVPIAERREWSDRVFHQILQRIPNGGLIRIFAGDRYREFLVPLLEGAGYSIDVPLQGLGIGQQLQWFKNNTNQPKQLHFFQ